MSVGERRQEAGGGGSSLVPHVPSKGREGASQQGCRSPAAVPAWAGLPRGKCVCLPNLCIRSPAARHYGAPGHPRPLDGPLPAAAAAVKHAAHCSQRIIHLSTAPPTSQKHRPGPLHSAPHLAQGAAQCAPRPGRLRARPPLLSFDLQHPAGKHNVGAAGLWKWHPDGLRGHHVDGGRPPPLPAAMTETVRGDRGGRDRQRGMERGGVRAYKRLVHVLLRCPVFGRCSTGLVQRPKGRGAWLMVR